MSILMIIAEFGRLIRIRIHHLSYIYSISLTLEDADAALFLSCWLTFSYVSFPEVDLGND